VRGLLRLQSPSIKDWSSKSFLLAQTGVKASKLDRVASSS
jgi:hypothetical protein